MNWDDVFRLTVDPREELMSKLRAQGVERVDEVERATMEPDGIVTVIRFDKEHPSSQARRRPV